jgi:hypothetical protein
VPGLQLALATAATVYLLREEKRAGLGKAVALALGGLVAGTLVGAAAQSWLRVDVIPLGVSSDGCCVICIRPQWRHSVEVQPSLSGKLLLISLLVVGGASFLQGLSSPGILVGEFSIVALAAVCLFLA